MLAETMDNALPAEGAPTGSLYRSAWWTTHLSGTERLADLLAAEWATERLHWLTADTNSSSRLARQFARSAARWALRQAHAWDDYADELTEQHRAAERAAAAALVADEIDGASTAIAGSSEQVIGASLAPMNYHRWSALLENHGTRILRAALQPSARPDVWVRARQVHVARRDRVAFTGQVRWQPPQPCRYGQNGQQQGALRLWTVDTAGIVTVPATVDLLTTDYSRPQQGRRREGWLGHRRITWTLAAREPSIAERARRAAAAEQRAAVNATGKRGRPVTAWEASPRSLLRAAAPLAARVEALAGTVAALAAGQQITFNDGTAVTVLGRAEVDYCGSRYSTLEFSRRAVLAGLTTT